MKDTFTPGLDVEDLHSKGITINEPATANNGKGGAHLAGQSGAVEQFKLPADDSEESGWPPSAIKKALADLQTDPDDIVDESVAGDYRLLLQLVEQLSAANEKLKAENQRLRDEINRLKGEQGKPKIKASRRGKPQDSSSEKERKSRQSAKKRKSKAKKHKIKIDRTEVCPVDPSVLPEDAEFKGYQSVVVQEIIIETDNVKYEREIYYSASQKKTYLGALPAEVEGEFGPGVKSLVYTQKHVANMSEPKIKEFLKNVGIHISKATISRILTHNNEQFHQEKADIFRAGLEKTSYQQIDDTGARVKGENQHVHIVCNPFYTAYFTTPRKDRLTVLDILQGGQVRSYCFNAEAFSLLETLRVSEKVRAQLRELAWERTLDEEQMQQMLQQLFPDPSQGKNTRIRIMEAGAIAAYNQQTDFPVIPALLSDDAPQFKRLTREQGLCWIHDGRHYKKLHPVVPLHQEKLVAFREKYWDYYQKLLQYQENPSQEQAEALSAEFDELFSTQTHYPALDERIATSKAKKPELLLVLKYPELPLHNNEAELAARVQARKRDVSLHTMSLAGTQSQDTFLTIVETAKKLGVSAYDYIYDRVSKRYRLPSLAELIRVRNSPKPEADDTS